MKRGSGFVRGAEAMARRKAKQARKKPLVQKAAGRALVDKDAHLRSDAHLALVRAQPCIVSRLIGHGIVPHHAQECFPHITKQGGKISDFLCVPLYYGLHDPATPGSLHHMNSANWWDLKGVDPLAWLRGFLRRHYKPGHPGADHALEQIRIVEERRR